MNWKNVIAVFVFGVLLFCSFVNYSMGQQNPSPEISNSNSSPSPSKTPLEIIDECIQINQKISNYSDYELLNHRDSLGDKKSELEGQINAINALIPSAPSKSKRNNEQKKLTAELEELKKLFPN